MLVPEVLEPRRNRRPLGASLVLALAVPPAALGSLAVVLALHSGPAPAAMTFAPQWTIEAAPATPAPLPAPLPAPAPAATRASCPAPRTDAPWVAPKFDEPITGVHPAPSNAGWIAAWNSDHIFVSYDAGATFTRVLDGPGNVVDVSFDCFGRAIALRSNHVGIHEGTREAWHDVAGLRGHDDDPGLVLGGGPDAVVLANSVGDAWSSRLAISRDDGATWGYHDLTGDFEPSARARGWQRADGSIDVALPIADCMSDELWWTRIVGNDMSTVTDGMGEGASFAIYDDLVVDDSRWRTRSGDWHDLPRPPDGVWYTVVPGAFPVLVAGDKTYKLDHGKLRALPLVVEGAPQAVDLAGRVWSIACGKVLVAQRTATGAGCDDCN